MLIANRYPARTHWEKPPNGVGAVRDETGKKALGVVSRLVVKIVRYWEPLELFSRGLRVWPSSRRQKQDEAWTIEIRSNLFAAVGNPRLRARGCRQKMGRRRDRGTARRMAGRVVALLRHYRSLTRAPARRRAPQKGRRSKAFKNTTLADVRSHRRDGQRTSLESVAMARVRPEPSWNWGFDAPRRGVTALLRRSPTTGPRGESRCGGDVVIHETWDHFPRGSRGVQKAPGPASRPEAAETRSESNLLFLMFTSKMWLITPGATHERCAKECPFAPGGRRLRTRRSVAEARSSKGELGAIPNSAWCSGASSVARHTFYRHLALIIRQALAGSTRSCRSGGRLGVQDITIRN